jgi:hypothetical protein
VTTTTTADAGSPTTGRLLVNGPTLHAAAIEGAMPHTTIRADDQIRHALLVAVLLLLAVAGFVTARVTSATVHEPAAPVCSEICGPLSTTTRAPQAGRKTEEPWRR